MKDVKALLNEVKGEQAHKQAVQMGLKYKGFGYWVDPNTNEVTHKTENDQLVAVEPEVESEKAGPTGSEEATAAPSGGMGNPEGLGGSFGTFMNKQMPTGMGTNVQDIGPDGIAQAPNTDNARWEPGPDGDTFAGDEDVSQDKFDWNKPKKDSYVGKTNHYGWTAGKDGDNYTTMTMDQILKKAYSINLDDYESTEVPTMSEGKSFTSAFKDDEQVGDYLKARASYDKLHRQKPSEEDNKTVSMMNAAVPNFVSDPDFDMSQKGDMIGQGDYGKIYDSADGSKVIKEGRIGKEEAKILHMLKDNPHVPNIVNAQFKTPFTKGAIETDDLHDLVNSGKQHEYAEGIFAMDKVAGEKLQDAIYGMDDEQKAELAKKLFKIRAGLHMAGIAHNDMHGGNIFYDKDNDNMSVLDFGRAQARPMAALMEAFGTLDDKDGDHQLFDGIRDKGILEKLSAARDNIMGGENFQAGDSRFGELLKRGGLALQDSEHDALEENFPNLNPENIKAALKEFYGDLVDDEEEQPSDAYNLANRDSRAHALGAILRAKANKKTPILDKLTDNDN